VFGVRHATFNAGLGLGAVGAAVVVSVSHPHTFTAIYIGDAVSFLAFAVVLGRLRLPEQPLDQHSAGPSAQAAARESAAAGFRMVLRDKAFVAVWALTALIVTVSFGQFNSSFPGYATRPGGIGTHGLALAFAADTVTVVAVQLVVLRWLAGHRRTTGAALAAVTWAVSWAVVILAGHLGGGIAAEMLFVVGMVVFAVGETFLSPTLPAIINDLAPPEAVGRYNGLGVLAFTTGFLLGPVVGSAALGAGWGSWLFGGLVAGCLVAAVAALRLGRRLPIRVNEIESSATD
jgi:MFS family permease